MVRLKPPVYASKSIISPAKYNPLTSFDSIVIAFICFTDTPPAVTIASSKEREPVILQVKFLRRVTNLFRSSFVIWLTGFSGGILLKSIITGINRLEASLSENSYIAF